jgi:hypothetical protein
VNRPAAPKTGETSRRLLPRGPRLFFLAVGLFVGTIAVGYLVLLGVFAALPGENTPDLNTVLMNAPWSGIILCALAMLFAMVPLNGLRWGHVVYVLSGTRPTLRHSSVIFTGAATTNIIIPGVFGELMPGLMLHGLYGLPVNVGLAAQLYTRIVAITTYALTAAVCWVFMPAGEYDPVVHKILAFGIVVVTIPCGALILLAFAPALVRRLAGWSVRTFWPAPRDGEKNWVTRTRFWIIDMGDTGYALHTLMKKGGRALIPTVVITWLLIGCYALAVSFCAWLVAHWPDPLTATVVVILNQFAALAALILPLGVGGQEVALTAMGPALVGNDWALVAALTIAVRLSMNIANILGIPIAVESLRYIKMDDAELERYRQAGALKLAFDSATAD